MKHAVFGAAIALVAGITPAWADMTDIRFTLGWKTQGSDAPFLMALQQGLLRGRRSERDHRPGRRLCRHRDADHGRGL